jgi:hypothetical protein
MGCATQELTAAASQQQTEKMPPSQNAGSTYQLPNNGLALTTTKLKQSHSALVKLLESAPISTPAPQPPANTTSNGQHEVAVDQKTTTNHHHHHHYRKKMVKQLEHIKQNSDSDISKSLESSSSQKVISDNVKSVSKVSQMCPEQGPPSCSGSDEDDAKLTASADQAVAPLPWKKTRIAREWRQKKQQEETPTVVVSPPPPQPPQTEPSANNEQASAVQPMDTDEEDMDVCEHHLLENLYHNDDHHMCRRNSLESCSDGGGPNDSGCDSDCPDNNINELCKRFDENLTDEDVCVVRHYFFLSLNFPLYTQKKRKLCILYPLPKKSFEK